MKASKVYKVLILCLVITMVAVGCGPAAPAPDPDEDGELSRIIVIAQEWDMTNIDPHANNDLATQQATRMMYDNLVRLSTDNEFIPGLAESWEWLDGNTIEFRLREGVKFHDGHVLNTEDVKYSMARTNASGYGSHLFTMIEEFEIIDELTFRLHVTDESAALLSGMQHPAAAIVAKDYTEQLEADGKTLGEFPMGTGPYYFDYWRVGSEIQMLRFDDYFEEEYMARNQGLRIRYMPEESSRVVALETGEVDILLSVPTASIADLEANPDVKVLPFDSTHVAYIALNCMEPPFDNPDLRKAVSHAVNRENMIQVQAMGYAAPNWSPIGLSAIGYSDTEVRRDYDIEKAQEYLAAAGYPDGGFSFTLSVLEGYDRTGAVFQADAAAAGIDVKVEIMEASALFSMAGAADHQAAICWWVANAEPDNTYSPMFHSRNIAAGGWNWICYESDYIDGLIRQALLAMDPAERQEAYTAINNYNAEQALYLPLFSLDGFVATRANVDGIVLYGILHHLYQHVTVSN